MASKASVVPMYVLRGGRRNRLGQRLSAVTVALRLNNAVPDNAMIICFGVNTRQYRFAKLKLCLRMRRRKPRIVRISSKNWQTSANESRGLRTSVVLSKSLREIRGKNKSLVRHSRK